MASPFHTPIGDQTMTTKDADSLAIKGNSTQRAAPL